MPLSNAPRILRGAFIEYGLSIPPLFVVFQFNPVELTRTRNLTFGPENEPLPCPPEGEGEEAARARCAQARQQQSMRAFHQKYDSLSDIRDRQVVAVQEETLSFEIRLDATDKLEAGDPIAAGFGVLPQLATLELMVHPKEESLLGAALGSLLGKPEGFSFTKKENPPMVLFVWGAKRVLPVNIQSLTVTETEFSTLLDPIRATVAVNLTVIEGRNPFSTYSKVAKEISSVLNLANIADIANVVVPG
jgi:hypothetical protein